MRPRLIAVDDAAQRAAVIAERVASMRPRLIAVDDLAIGDEIGMIDSASMRPRLIAVDDATARASTSRSRPSFNEATAYCRG